MQKPAGVIVAAILLAFCALIGTISAASLVAISLLRPASGAMTQSAAQITQGVLFAFLALPTLYAWFVVVGLFRGRNWARIGAIVLGSLMTVMGGLFTVGMTAMLVLPQSRMQLATARPTLVIGALVYAILAAVGLWLVVYFNTQSVKQAFRPGTLYVPAPVTYTQPATLSGADAPYPPPNPVYGYTAVPAQPALQVGRTASVPRIVVLVFALFSLIGSLSLFGMAAAGMPLFYLGVTLHGPAAALALVVLGALNIVIAIGLYRRFVPAYYAALALQLIGAISSLSLLVPSFRARTLEASLAVAARMTPQQSPQMQAQMQGMMHSMQNGALLFNAILLPFVFAFFAWALWRDLAATRKPVANAGELRS